MRNYDPHRLESVARSVQAANNKKLGKIYKSIKKTKFPKGFSKLSKTIESSEHGYEDEMAGPHINMGPRYSQERYWIPESGTTSGYSGREDRISDLIKTLKDNYKGLYGLRDKYEDYYDQYMKIQNALENEKVQSRMERLKYKLNLEETPIHNIYPTRLYGDEAEKTRQELIARSIEAAKRDLIEGSGSIKDKNFTDAIKEYEKISLSNFQVFDLLNKKTRVLTYTELTNHEDIADVLAPHGCFVLLYLSKKDYGHWCCVIQHPDRIEFFDPYGTYIDNELEYISGDFRKKSEQMFPHLTKLLYDSGVPIEYNQYRFQKHGANINTCGRHVSMRILLKHMLLDEYHDFIVNTAKKLKTDADGLVTMLTLYINAKKKKIQ